MNIIILSHIHKFYLQTKIFTRESIVFQNPTIHADTKLKRIIIINLINKLQLRHNIT